MELWVIQLCSEAQAETVDSESRPTRRASLTWPDRRVPETFRSLRERCSRPSRTLSAAFSCRKSTLALAAMVVQILFATRQLGLTERGVGLSYVALGAGTVLASAIGYRVVRRVGNGPTLVLGFAVSGAGWLVLSLAPLNAFGIASYAYMLLSFGVGAVFIFINFLSLRQSVTPAAMLGRMTSTMRWLILIPAGPGALLGGWLGEHWGLRVSLGFAGSVSLLLAAVASRLPVIRDVRTLPTLKAEAVTPYCAESGQPALLVARSQE